MKKHLFIVLILILSGCFDEGDCLINASNVLRIDLLTVIGHAQDTVHFNYVTLSGVNGSFAQDTTLSNLFLPLYSEYDTATIILRHRITFSPEVYSNDTIKIKYHSYGKVITSNCGAFTYFDQLAITHTNLPRTSYKLVNTILIKDPTSQSYATNLQIFY